MKLKIILPLGLLSLAFISSSYIINKDKSSVEYQSINELAIYKASKNNLSNNLNNCAKCHDCTGQNVQLDTIQVNIKSSFTDEKKSAKPIQTNKTGSPLKVNEVTDLETPLQPDAFKNKLRN